MMHQWLAADPLAVVVMGTSLHPLKDPPTLTCAGWPPSPRQVEVQGQKSLKTVGTVRRPEEDEEVWRKLSR